MKGKLSLLLLLVGVLLGLSVQRIYNRFFSPLLRITFFDVAQGDAALIQFPKGKTMLIDAGGGMAKWNMGQRVLIPELLRMGILKLDMALVTHPDRDHALGFQGILSELPTAEFWYKPLRGGKRHQAELLDVLRALALSKGTQLKRIESKRTLSIGGVELTAFPINYIGTSNNQPLVIHIKYRGCSFLFPADAEGYAERQIMKEFLGSISVLKVAHHGSRHSTPKVFLEHFKPKMGIVSSGLKNSYGHPHRELIERLRSHLIQILRTDFHGFVRFEVAQNGRMVCTTSHGNCGEFQCQ